MFDRTKKFINKQRVAFAKKTLEGNLREIVDLTQGHKATGLPPGHEYYQRLQNRSLDSIMNYQKRCEELGTLAPTREEIAVGVPMLTELNNLASGCDTKAQKTGELVGKLIAATFFGGTVLTMVLAIWHDLYLMLTHWVNVRW
jgi:hypothetical protein